MNLPLVIASTLLMLVMNSAQGDTIYKYYDKHGNAVFTDEPVKGAEPLEVPKVSTVPAMPVPKTQPAAPKPLPFAYDSIAITAPEPEENFINNQGTFTVAVQVQPRLRSSDRIQLYFNGQPQGEAKAVTSFPFTNMDRGSYKVEAEVVNQDGKPMGRSEAVTFFVRRPSINQPQRSQP